jgi:bifunctional DNase/RNase
MGLTHTETAAALGIPIGAVKTRLHKARASLRRQLAALWEETEPMSTTQIPQGEDYVEVRIIDVRRILPNERYTIPRTVVLLQEIAGNRRVFGIWIGPGESDTILILMSGVDVPRPLTFNFALNLLEAAGGQLREVRVSRLVDKTYYAEAIIQVPDRSERVIDARPSDAIALALIRNAPIRVAESVMREVTLAPDFLEQELTVDGTRVLGKAEIARELERVRHQFEAERQQRSAELRERDTSAQSQT